jgi:hypothetical protein
MATSTSLQSELTKLATYPPFRLSVGNPHCLVVMMRQSVAFDVHYQKFASQGRQWMDHLLSTPRRAKYG